MFVSVIIPVFNAEKYLHQAIQSILFQTFTDFELIIIDDGSTDNSLTILQSFDDIRIKLIQNQGNQGISTSLNKGIDLAKGKYIARMDADDIAMPERLEKQVAFLEKNPNIDLLGSSIENIDYLGKSKGFDIADYKKERIECLLVFTCPLYHPTIMAKKTVFEELKYDLNYDGVEDWELWIRIVKKYTIIRTSDVLLQYRRHDNNLSKAVNSAKNIKLYKLVETQLHHYFNINNTKSIQKHLESCTSLTPNSISAKEIEGYKSWLLTFITQNTSSFKKVDLVFAINLTWFYLINRTLKERKYSIIKVLLKNDFNLSSRKRRFILLKAIGYSKIGFLFSPFKQFVISFINRYKK